MFTYRLINKNFTLKGEKYNVLKKNISDRFTYIKPEKFNQFINEEKINYISVLPGSGKTNWAINSLYKGCKKEDFIYVFVAPTVKLLSEVHKGLLLKLKDGSLDEKRIHKIHGLAKDKYPLQPISVSEIFENKLTNAHKGDVFLITHSLYTNLETIPNRDKIFLIIDEAQNFNITEFKLNHSLKNLDILKKIVYLEIINKTSHLDTEGKSIRSDKIETYFKVHAKTNLPRKFEEKFSVIATKEYKKFIKFITNKSSDVFMSENKNGDGYNFFKFISPNHLFKGLAKVYLMGAFFEESHLYHTLNKYHKLNNRSKKVSARISEIKTRFKKLKIIPILLNLRDSYRYDGHLSQNLLSEAIIYRNKRKELKHLKRDFTLSFKAYKEIISEPNAHRAKINFLNSFLEKREEIEEDMELCGTLQKDINEIMEPLRKKYSASLIRLLDHLLITTTNHFKTKISPLVIVNKKYLDLNLSDIIKKDNFITGNVHGLNGYSSRNVMAYLAAIRPSTTLINFYEKCIPNHNWHSNLIAANIVQAVCRLNIRNINTNRSTYLYLPAKETAVLVKKFLSSYGCKVAKLSKPLDSKSNLLTLKDIISTQKKPRKGKDYLSTSDEHGNKIKIKTEEFFRKDEIYRKLNIQITALRRKIRNCASNGNQREHNILLKEKDKISSLMKKRKDEISPPGYKGRN